MPDCKEKVLRSPAAPETVDQGCQKRSSKHTGGIQPHVGNGRSPAGKDLNRLIQKRHRKPSQGAEDQITRPLGKAQAEHH